MFIATLLIVAKMWKQSSVHQLLKKTVVYPYNGILFSTKKEKIAHTWYNMNKLQKHYARPKKKKKGYILW